MCWLSVVVVIKRTLLYTCSCEELFEAEEVGIEAKDSFVQEYRQRRL